MMNEDTVTGHSVDSGEVQWTFELPGFSNGPATCSQPVVVSDQELLVAKGYGEGSTLLRFRLEDGTLRYEVVWKDKSILKTKFTTALVRDGFAYGLSDGTLECVNLATGKRMWKKGRYGHGQCLGVGTHLLISSEDGDLILVKSNPNQFEEVARIHVLDGITWNIPSLAGPWCLMRNASSMACLQLPLAETASPSELKPKEGQDGAQ